MPDVNPRPRAGAIRRSVNSADQKGVGSGLATAAELMLGPLRSRPRWTWLGLLSKTNRIRVRSFRHVSGKPVRGMVPRAAGLRDKDGSRQQIRQCIAAHLNRAAHLGSI